MARLNNVVGTFLGKYEILGEHRRGGMAVVYRARHVTTRKEVAIKLFRDDFLEELTESERGNFAERFRREAEATANIEHKNVVEVYDFDFAKGSIPSYIAMEYLRGQPLGDLLKKGKLPLERALNLMIQICAGVGAAHNKNIVHRDLKPANIMILPSKEEDEGETVKIIDFGIAKIFDSELTKITKQDNLIGTTKYMSPEQCEGQLDPDSRSDVYNLGLIFYEMLSGKFPFEGQSNQHWIVNHLMKEPEPLPAEFPEELVKIVMRSLTKDREERPGSARELKQNLVEFKNSLNSTGRVSRENTRHPPTRKMLDDFIYPYKREIEILKREFEKKIPKRSVLTTTFTLLIITWGFGGLFGGYFGYSLFPKTLSAIVLGFLMGSLVANLVTLLSFFPERLLTLGRLIISSTVIALGWSWILGLSIGLGLFLIASVDVSINAAGILAIIIFPVTLAILFRKEIKWADREQVNYKRDIQLYSDSRRRQFLYRKINKALLESENRSAGAAVTDVKAHYPKARE